MWKCESVTVWKCKNVKNYKISKKNQKYQKIKKFQKNQIFLKFQRFQKVFWNPRCYQHLWCLLLLFMVHVVAWKATRIKVWIEQKRQVIAPLMWKSLNRVKIWFAPIQIYFVFTQQMQRTSSRGGTYLTKIDFFNFVRHFHMVLYVT